MSREAITAASAFPVKGRITSVNSYGEGHIHETYLVETADHNPDYVLQKINGNVFRDIPAMMRNMEAVTGHLRVKLAGMEGHDPTRETLTLIRTKDGQLFYEDGQGDSWRMFIFIPGTFTYQQLPELSLAAKAGRAIGNFQWLLADLATPLETTIPDFHNIHFRIRQYLEARQRDPMERAREVLSDLAFAEARFARMQAYLDSLNKGVPVRVTHNDTKLNNILFDVQSRAVCVIDLDTVMPGFIHFDYGDALRTLANTAPEDERDLSKVTFNLDVHREFTQGYLESVKSFLTDAERELLPFAPIYLTFIIGLRFMTDYLDGDRYFRVHYPDHNLVRARAQFRLTSEMEKAIPFNEYEKS